MGRDEKRQPWRVVIIEDTRHDRAEIKAALLRGSSRRYEFLEAETGAAGVALCETQAPHAVVLDFHLPDMTALEVLAALPQEAGLPALPVVVLTAAGGAEVNRNVLRAGAQGFVGKDWMTSESLTRVLESSVERHAMARELRETAEALARSHTLLRTVADATDNVIFAKDLEGRYILVNRAWSELFGLAEGEGVGMTDEEAGGPELASMLRTHDQQVLAAGEVQRFEEHLSVPGRGEVTYQSSRAPLHGEAGRLVGVCGVSTDLTALKRAESLNRSLMDGSTDCVKVLDLEGRLLLMNLPGLRQLGIDDFDLWRGRDWSACCPEPMSEEVRRAVAEAREGRSCSFEGFCPTSAGVPRWWGVTVSPVRDHAGGPVVRLLAVSHDITDSRQLEAEREQLLAAEQAARAELERVGQIKDEFLATLSHELRTPLNAIVGWAQVLQRVETDNRLVRQGIEVIVRNADAQAQLIDDLLDMNRILSGKLKMQVSLVDLNVVGVAAMDTVRAAAAAKGVSLTFALEPDLPPVSGDEGRLRQVVWNLLSNAVKFTPSGGKVTLSTGTSETGVWIAVEDTGQGLDPAFLPRLFDRFSQADASAARKHGGLGLGLSIALQLVELQGGSIRAESEGPGRGSCFTVQLPAAEGWRPEDEPRRGLRASPAAEAAADLPGLSLESISVLVVDDQLDALEAARRLLSEYGASVSTATSARDALDQLRRQPPNVLLSDIGMPEMDGYRLIREVRDGLGLTPEKLPAAVLTAFSRAEDRNRALEAGYQAHISKPLRPQTLIATVASLARARSLPTP